MPPLCDRVLTKRRLIDISAAPPDFRSRQASCHRHRTGGFIVNLTGPRVRTGTQSSRSTARAKTASQRQVFTAPLTDIASLEAIIMG